MVLFGIKLHSLRNTFTDIMSLHLQDNFMRKVGGIVSPILQINGLFGSIKGPFLPAVAQLSHVKISSDQISHFLPKRQCCLEQSFCFGSILVTRHLQSLASSLSLNFWFQFLSQPQYLTEEFLLEYGKRKRSSLVLCFYCSCMD